MTPRSSCPGGEATPLRGANLRHNYEINNLTQRHLPCTGVPGFQAATAPPYEYPTPRFQGAVFLSSTACYDQLQMDFTVADTYGAVSDLMRCDPDVVSGVKRLVEHCNGLCPSPVWDEIAALDLSGDSAYLKRWLHNHLSRASSRFGSESLMRPVPMAEPLLGSTSQDPSPMNPVTRVPNGHAPPHTSHKDGTPIPKFSVPCRRY
jgi:hypothetical protein